MSAPSRALFHARKYRLCSDLVTNIEILGNGMIDLFEVQPETFL